MFSNLQAGLVAAAAAAVVAVDVALWLANRQAVTAGWIVYGLAVWLMAAVLAGLLSFSLQRYRGPALSSDRFDLWAAKVRQRSDVFSQRRLHDPQEFHERLREELRRNAAYGCKVGLIVLRVGGSVAPGAPVREVVAERVGSLLRHGLRRSDLGGHLGPDEFAICLPDTDRGGSLVIGATLIGLLEGVVSGTIGVAVFPEDAHSPHGLVTAARRRAVPYTDTAAA